MIQWRGNSTDPMLSTCMIPSDPLHTSEPPREPSSPPTFVSSPPVPSDKDSLILDQGESLGPMELPPAVFSICVVVGVLLLWMGYSLTQRPVPNRFSATFAARVTQTKIDPNTASWASLVRIPDIGPARAEKLLTWRKAHQTAPSQIVFHSPADLRRVPSFGPKTVASISKYLRFPLSESSGRPGVGTGATR